MPAPDLIRVLVVDDQELVRLGLRMILGEAGIEVAGECEDGEQALRAVEELRPDVVLMDVRMRGMDGAEATRQLRRRGDAPPVLVLTTYGDDEVLEAALTAGAAGFLLKDGPGEDLVRAVRAVAAGGSWLDPAVAGRVLRVYRWSAGGRSLARARLDGLTPRELDVLRLVARGQSNEEIGRALFIGETTVKTHVGRLLSKLGLRDRAQLIVFAHDRGVD